MEALFTLLNVAALVGWSLVLFALINRDVSATVEESVLFEPTSSSFSSLPSDRILLVDILLALEGICLVEVGRIASGRLKGNLVLGAVLHAIRLTCLSLVLPGGLALSASTSNVGGDTDGEKWLSMGTIATLVLYSWALTEVGRYPMYIFPSSDFARKVRLVLPVATFPLGAFAEALGAFRVGKEMVDNPVGGGEVVKICMLGAVVLINSLLGPTLAYPALLKKGIPVLLGKTAKKEAATKKKKV